jgi:anthranilate phosphoribosyltransferase
MCLVARSGSQLCVHCPSREPSNCAAAAVLTLLQYSLLSSAGPLRAACTKYYLNFHYTQYTQTHISTEAYAIHTVAAANRTDQSC